MHLAPNDPAQYSDDLGSIAQQKAICAGAYLQKWGHNHPLSVDPVYFVQFFVLAAYVELCTFSGFFFRTSFNLNSFKVSYFSMADLVFGKKLFRALYQTTMPN